MGCSVILELQHNCLYSKWINKHSELSIFIWQLHCNSVSNGKQVLNRGTCTYLLFHRIQKIHVRIRNNYLEEKGKTKKKKKRYLITKLKTLVKDPQIVFLKYEDLATKVICCFNDIFHRENKAISAFQILERWQFSHYFLKETNTKQGK